MSGYDYDGEGKSPDHIGECKVNLKEVIQQLEMKQASGVKDCFVEIKLLDAKKGKVHGYVVVEHCEVIAKKKETHLTDVPVPRDKSRAEIDRPPTRVDETAEDEAESKNQPAESDLEDAKSVTADLENENPETEAE